MKNGNNNNKVVAGGKRGGGKGGGNDGNPTTTSSSTSTTATNHLLLSWNVSGGIENVGEIGENSANSDSADVDVDVDVDLLDARHLHTYGFVVIKNFLPLTTTTTTTTNEQTTKTTATKLNLTTVEDMKRYMFELVETHWHPNGEGGGDGGEQGDEKDDGKQRDRDDELQSFGTDSKSNLERGDYFLDSSNKIHFFAEQDALILDEDGKKNVLKLKPEYLQPHTNHHKWDALNKTGHGLHLPNTNTNTNRDNPNPHQQQRRGNRNRNSNNPFYDYTTCPKLRDLIKRFGYEDPMVAQSMYIFKQSKIGGTVHCHQDSTFLFTCPRQTCLGLWLALDDATITNGCLWVRPYSHHEPLRRQFIKNPMYYDHYNNNDGRGRGDGNDGDEASSPPPPPPKLVFREFDNDSNDSNKYYDGKLPPIAKLLGVGVDLDDDDLDVDAEQLRQILQPLFVPVEVKAGDLVCFVGTLDHFSLPNLSSHGARHTFQLHLIEGPNSSQNTQWSSENWLQYPTSSFSMSNDGGNGNSNSSSGTGGDTEFLRLFTTTTSTTPTATATTATTTTSTTT